MFPIAVVQLRSDRIHFTLPWNLRGTICLASMVAWKIFWLVRFAELAAMFIVSGFHSRVEVHDVHAGGRNRIQNR